MREVTRRATMKRSSLKRPQTQRHSGTSQTQLDAIQRGQKLLDARLQDLQVGGATMGSPCQ